jgi:hypothetical protein
VLKQVNLLLLPVNSAIELINQIFGEVDFYFQFSQTIFHAGFPTFCKRIKRREALIVMQAGSAGAGKRPLNLSDFKNSSKISRHANTADHPAPLRFLQTLERRTRCRRIARNRGHRP